MAILVQKNQNNAGFFPLIIVLVILGLFAVLSYYLFFAPAPQTEVVLPPSLQLAEELATVQFDPATVVGGEQFQALQQHTGNPTTGTLGKGNPFVR